MTDATEHKLEQAYNLMQQEDLESATAILQPLLINEPQNPDVWWLWANVAENPEDARHALDKVLQYDPDHAAAQAMQERLNELYPPVVEASADFLAFGEEADFDDLYGDSTTQETVEPASIDLPEMPPQEDEDGEFEIKSIRRLDFSAETDADDDDETAVDFTGLFEEDDDMLPPFEDGDTEDSDEAAEPASRRPVLRYVLIALLLVVVVVSVFVLFNLLNRPITPDPVAQATDVPQTAQDIEPSENAATVLEAAASAANAQADRLGGEATVQLEERGGEPVLIIRVCRPAGADLSRAMAIAMETAARYSVSIEDEISAIGADLVNCARDDVLLRATTAVEDAVAFANDDLSLDAFRETWQYSSD
jgi:tetratricopeptide (TPR) repeat protein